MDEPDRAEGDCLAVKKQHREVPSPLPASSQAAQALLLLTEGSQQAGRCHLWINNMHKEQRKSYETGVKWY